VSEQREDSLTYGGRLDGAIYAVERGLITGALLVMTFTYFLQIVHREMHAQLNAFDLMFLRWRGFDPQTASPELVDFVTSVQTPVVLASLTFLMALLAVRTRLRSDEALDPKAWSLGRRALVAVALTVGGALVLKLIAWIPARWTCLLVLGGMVLPAVRGNLRASEHFKLAGSVVGGCAVGAFFVTHVSDDYVWSVELSSVLLMYVGFFGASMATRDGRHIQVDAIRKKLSPVQLPLYNAICGAVTVAFCVLLLVLAIQYVAGQLHHGGKLQATGLPEVAVSLPIAVSLCLMVVRFGSRAMADLRTWRRGESVVPDAMGMH